jgi:hypothetical protein
MIVRGITCSPRRGKLDIDERRLTHRSRRANLAYKVIDIQIAIHRNPPQGLSQVK